jgi:RNA polymerase sigma-70 factor (ECF subfamily)
VTSVVTDSELIARSRAEPRAFAEIFDRHHDELYRYLRRRVGPVLAADIASEIFVTAFARRGAYRADCDSARPWLYGIAHNLLRNQSRRERRLLLAYERHGAVPETDHSASDAFSEADDRADAVAGTSEVARILAQLSVRDRDVLLMFAWAEMSYSEIASALRIPVGTVRSRLNRARRQFRRPDAEISSYLAGETPWMT